MPVLAPEGTAARPSVPSARTTSTSTVGLPRLSRISRPRTRAIGAGCVLIVASRLHRDGVGWGFAASGSVPPRLIGRSAGRVADARRSRHDETRGARPGGGSWGAGVRRGPTRRGGRPSAGQERKHEGETGENQARGGPALPVSVGSYG